MKKLFLVLFLFLTALDHIASKAVNFSSNDKSFKAENNSFNESDSTDWLPLEVGNEWHFNVYHAWTFDDIFWFADLEFELMKITDSTYIDNIKYYLINEFFGFPDGTPVRYDFDSSKIIVYRNETENVFMDFSLPDSSTFLQLQPNNTLMNVTVVSKSKTILDSTIYLKGFYRGIIPTSHRRKGWYYFSKGLGFVYQDEWTNYWSSVITDKNVIEYLLFNCPYDTLHKKHKYVPSIQFEPLFFLPDSIIEIEQEFQILHEYSVGTYPNSGVWGRSYIDTVFLDSYYTNGIDTIVNPQHGIIPLTEIDFSLSFSLDTSLYNEGYNLYYKIVAIDKGLIPTYYYKPDSGYYRLYWRDSTASIVQSEINTFNYSLTQNYPNPFNPTTRINYSISNSEKVTIKIYDVLGREIRTLVNEEKAAGAYEVEFDADNLSSGIYYYQLKAGNFVQTRKMILLR